MSTNYLKQFYRYGTETKPKDIYCNHLILSSLLAEKAKNDDMESLNFYEATSVRKLIDMQTPLALKIDWFLKWSYLMFFVVPFFINIYINQLQFPSRFLRKEEENKTVAIITMSICLVCQLFFIMLELIEMYYKGLLHYFSQVFNIFQIIQYTFFGLNIYFGYKIMFFGEYEIGKDVPLDTWRFLLQVSQAFLTVGIFF